MDRLWYCFWDLDGESSGWRDTPVLKISPKEVTVKLNGSVVALDRAELERTGKAETKQPRTVVFTDAGRARVEAYMAEIDRQRAAGVVKEPP